MHSYFDPGDILFLGAYAIGIGDRFIKYLKSHRADFTTVYGYDEELIGFGDLDQIFKFNITHKLPNNAIIMCLYVWENQSIQNRAIKDQSF